MATITGLTAARMQEIIDSTIVDADVVGDNLILTKDDGSTIDAGSVRGPAGAPGAPASNLGKGAAFPAGPTDGDLFIRTDQVGDPLYKFTDGAWVVAAGGITKATSFPSTPAEGDLVMRTDQSGDPIYKYVGGIWQSQQMAGAQTVPAVRATLASGSQVVPGGTNAIVALPTEDFDTNTMHDPTTNNSRITIQTPGVYSVQAFVETSTNPPGGAIAINLFKNGALLGPDPYVLGPQQTTQGRVVLGSHVRLAAGDYLEIQFGNNANPVTSLSVSRAVLSAVWLGGAGQTIDERGVPAVGAYPSAPQSVPSGTYTSLALDLEYFDTDSIHDPAANTRLTAKTPGLYLITAQATFVQNATGIRDLAVKQNGSSTIAEVDQVVSSGSNGSVLQLSTIVKLAAGDYVELQAYQNSGVSLNVTGIFSMALIDSGKTVTPYARARASVAQSIPANTVTALAFDAEDTDNDSIHDTATNTSRLVCRTAGVYSVVAHVEWSAGAGRELWIRQTLASGGTKILGETNADVSRQSVAAIAEMAVGDYIELVVYTTSATTTSMAGNNIPACAIVKVGAPNQGNSGIDPVEGVSPATMQNAWAAAGSRRAPGFYKDRNRVYLVGAIDGTAATGNAAFILPVGYCPPKAITQLPSLGANAGGTSLSLFDCEIGTNGAVSFFTLTGGGASGNANTKNLNLEGISFAL